MTKLQQLKDRIESVIKRPNFSFSNKQHVSVYRNLYRKIRLLDRDYKSYHKDTYKQLSDVKRMVYLKDVELFIARGYDRQKLFARTEEILLREKAIVCSLFLTGGRISEVLNIKMCDINLHYNNKPEINSNLILEMFLDNRKNIDQPIKTTIANGKNELYFIKGIIAYYKFRLKSLGITLPIRDVITRKVNYDGLSEALNTHLFVNADHTNSANSRKGRKVGVRWITYQLPKYYKCNTHFFRKVRATILVKLYGFDTLTLQKFMGWKTFDSSRSYVYLSTKDFVKNMDLEVR